ncbi:vWA domain-containing protein [Mangrovibacillus cuniculi]|uniref:VWFA domain-containing protein n=1 Tax=Mangrovibacillus cuniculi TaxID=2593652 RepID=A0A7S8CAT3_9BACI|nr:hypothetical protein [Mangrovibacillus cuniculi]QPC46555.1 hypothetical protein G8O30_06035 [Mangrovibacillus cuniculi]
MERFIEFNDQKVDSRLWMELADLVKTFMKDAEYDIEFAVSSYLDRKQKIVFVSHFWDHRSEELIKLGLKSDVFLRAYGNARYSDQSEVVSFIKKLKKNRLVSLGKQLFVLGEDLRIQEIVKKERKGTKRSFEARNNILWDYFATQQKTNVVKSVHTDALFNTLYLLVQADRPNTPIPAFPEQIKMLIPFLQRSMFSMVEARNTKQVSNIVLEMIETLDEIIEKDMLNEYFHLPEKVYTVDELGISFEDLKRQDKLANNDQTDEANEEADTFEEEMKMWHRETKDQKQEAFLQFNMDQGVSSKMLGNAAREGDDGDQALGMVQGKSSKSKQNDYNKLQSLERENEDKSGGKTEPYGKDNRFAVPKVTFPTPANYEQTKKYQQLKSDITTYQKKLQQMIEKTLEHKKIQPRTDLLAGRLGKKLLNIMMDDVPRPFYKKHEPSHEIDAVFSLLVDCSASMFDKMYETKKGITLFHEALKSVRVPHDIHGFWEDTNDATKEYQPNYFKQVVSFQTSMKKSTGPEIMQLEPEEDNRDGFAIRYLTESLKKRSESQKFLLVFSDGEPAATDYHQNGIVDTHEAILHARKNGIEVMNVFLSTEPIADSQKQVIQNMYGRFSLFVQDVNELPDVLFPLLRKLLLKSI